MRDSSFVIFAALLALAPQSAPAQKISQAPGSGHWVATWATAQQLQPAPAGGFGGRGRGPGPGPGAAPATGANSQATPTPPRSPQASRPNPNRTNLPATLSDQTIRMPIRV